MLLKVQLDANFPGKLDGVLLCGGLSSRMGRDKALIEVAGEALWLRQRRLLKNVLGQEPLLSVRHEKRLSSVGVEQRELRYVYDDGSSGPLGGILSAFEAAEAARATHVAVLAVDLPFMEIEWWATLIRACGALKGAIGKQEGGAGGWEPLAAIYPVSMGPRFRSAKAAGVFALQKIVAEGASAGLLEGVPIGEKQARLFRNWNTPADIE
jgi:molybdopterin-guanine dinucleotide biosynthesis protein A